VKLPNKITTYKESTLALFPFVLKTLEKRPHTVVEIYHLLIQKRNKTDVYEIIDTLDALFLLNKITFNSTTGELLYVV